MRRETPAYCTPFARDALACLAAIRHRGHDRLGADLPHGATEKLGNMVGTDTAPYSSFSSSANIAALTISSTSIPAYS